MKDGGLSQKRPTSVCKTEVQCDSWHFLSTYYVQGTWFFSLHAILPHLPGWGCSYPILQMGKLRPKDHLGWIFRPLVARIRTSVLQKSPHASVGPCHIFLLLPPNLTGVAECRLVDWGWRDIGTTVLLLLGNIYPTQTAPALELSTHCEHNHKGEEMCSWKSQSSGSSSR